MYNKINRKLNVRLLSMSDKLFTKEEINILSKNKYVKKVTSKGITYTDEFKKIL